MTEDSVLGDIFAAGAAPVWEIIGRHCVIQIAALPAYSNRGNWVATIDNGPPLTIDRHDLWPRYYFDLDRAKLEIEAWLDKRSERYPDQVWRQR